VQLKVDVLVVVIFSSICAAKEATKTIPIVMVTGGGPVATGLIDSLVTILSGLRQGISAWEEVV
jgi:putative tryptophan/tyrosine transport system substrate-binding protein